MIIFFRQNHVILAICPCFWLEIYHVQFFEKNHLSINFLPSADLLPNNKHFNHIFMIFAIKINFNIKIYDTAGIEGLSKKLNWEIIIIIYYFM